LRENGGQYLHHECFQLTAIENDQPNSSSTHARPLAIHVDREILTRIEMEATRTLIVGVTSLFITACPYFIFVCLFYLCRIVNQSDCSHFNWLAPYMKELDSLFTPFAIHSFSS
jgi:dopamine receptor D1